MQWYYKKIELTKSKASTWQVNYKNMMYFALLLPEVMHGRQLPFNLYANINNNTRNLRINVLERRHLSIINYYKLYFLNTYIIT